MKRILIIEDEPLAVTKLEDYIRKYSSNYEILEAIDSIEDAVEFLSNNEHPDLLFLDIQLADGLSFDIFDQIKVNKPIIFTTAYDQYAIKAFKLNSIDYLLKPYEFSEFEKAMKQFESMENNNSNSSIDLETLKIAMQQLSPNFKNRFIIKSGEKLLSISISDVESFYSEDKYTFLLTNEGKKHIINYTLDQLKEILNPKQFYRINRKYYININHIKDILTYSGSRLKVNLNTLSSENLIVSREKVTDFKKWLDK